MSGRARSVSLTLALIVAAAALVACGDKKEQATTTTITVWDYYGTATPIKPAIAAFEKAHPDVIVRYVPKEYDDIHAKFGPDSKAGAGPDVATLDMTWLSSLSAEGVLADVQDVSGGEINDQAIEHVYSSTALNAMTFQKRYVAAPLDFDTYALYYRSDLLRDQELPVPTTWDQLRTTARELAEAAERADKEGKWRIQISPDTFHFAQLLFQDGGTLLDQSERKAAFAGNDGVEALTAYRDLLDDGGLYWGPDQADSSGIDAIKDDRLAMFISGPYMMGVLKDGAPKQAGKWGVTPVPALGQANANERAGYLGGTGLGIPAKSKNKQAAWQFVEWMLQIKQQTGVIEHAGAAPTTNEAILSLELTDPDPFFGGQQPNLVFLDALSAARPMPHVKQWDKIDELVNTAVEQALLKKKSPRQALADAAKEVDKALAAG